MPLYRLILDAAADALRSVNRWFDGVDSSLYLRMLLVVAGVYVASRLAMWIREE